MIKIKDGDEFKRLLNGLSNDIVDAHIHHKMRKDLLKEANKYPLVFSQSNTFWSTTLRAHHLASFSLLSKAYDTDDKSLHLFSWLQTIKENRQLFEEKSFRERLKDNPFVDSLAKDSRVPDMLLLDADIRSCSMTDPMVKALFINRSNSLAHRNAKNTANAIDIADSYPISWDDFETLLARALTILNRYSSLFEAATYSTNAIGSQDYGYIFKCVNEAVQRSRDSR
jgi:hypothetical protein